MKNARGGILIPAVLSLALAACGGGGDDSGTPASSNNPSPPAPTPPATAEGVYGGTLTGSPSGASAFQGIVLENGEFWATYGQSLGSNFYVYGFVQGSGTSSNGTFNSSNLKDFGEIPAIAATVNSTYNSSAKTISGTISSAFGNTQFSGGPISGTTYSYTTAASLSAITGTWTVQDLQGFFYTINITGSGSFTASGGGCNANGTITPRPSGKNIFNVSVTFANSVNCAAPGLTATGVAISYEISATGQSELVAAVIDGQRTLGTVVFGVR